MNTYIISNIEEAADMAAYRGNPGLKGELVKGETSHDADLIRRYIADRSAQVAVIDMVQAAYSAAAIEERHRPLPVSLDEIANALTEREAAFGGLGPCGYAVIEEHAYRIVEALSEAHEPAGKAQAMCMAGAGARTWIYDYDARTFETYESGRSAESLKSHTRQSEVIVHRDSDGTLSVIWNESVERWIADHVFQIDGGDWVPADFN